MNYYNIYLFRAILRINKFEERYIHKLTSILRYVPSKYTAYGYTFDRMQHDASGKPAWGLYGHCTDGGKADI